MAEASIVGRRVSAQMDVLVFAPFYPPAYLAGGPVRSIEGVVVPSAKDFRVAVLTRNRDLGAAAPMDVPSNAWTERSKVLVKYVETRSFRHYTASLINARKYRGRLLYFNTFFDVRLSIIPQLLTLLGFWRPAQRVVAVRGEFGTAALSIRGRKKRAFILLYKSLGLHRGVIWHASSPKERSDILAVVGQGARVIVRGNDTFLPAAEEAEVKPPSDRFKAVFLGRLVPIKGLDRLLEALAHCAEPIVLDIHGPNQDLPYVKRCLEISERLPSNVTVNFLGGVIPEKVRPTLAKYDMMLMPTLGENFGQVIAESLSVGVPVMAMDVTPWTDTLRGGGGVVVGPSAADWTQAVSAAAQLSLSERHLAKHAAFNAYRTWRASRPAGSIFQDVLTDHARDS